MATPTPSPSLVPAHPPPPGVVSNFEHPASLQYQSNIAIAISICLTTIFFALRSYTRIFIKRAWILEDWLVFTSWAGTAAYCGIMGATMSHYGGKHIWDITVPQSHQAAYWFNAASIEYGVTIGITKLAILSLYRRIFSPQRLSLFDIIIVGLIVIIVLFYGSTSFVKIFSCSPRARIWNKDLPGTCIDTSRLLNTSGMFNTLTDFLILFLPVKAVWDMNMKRQKKIIVVLVFTFGLCAPIFSLVGFIVRFRDSGNVDTSWNQPEILLWGTAELTAGNLCVCFPEMGALLRLRSRQRTPGPPASIVNGDYLRSRRTRDTGKSKSNAQSAEAGSYRELDDEPEQGTVLVTHEVKVHSQTIQMEDLRHHDGV